MSSVRLLTGDCRWFLRWARADSVDAIVTDPPYELGFMGKRWDRAGVAFDPRTWAACHRVLKPGGRLLAFGAPRTHHRIWCAIEDAGFVIEDTIQWLFGSGFPKHKSKLKPFHEPICVARKGKVSALNIDAARIGTIVDTWPASRGYSRHDPGSPVKATQSTGTAPAGRWPPNVAMDEGAAAVLDEQSGRSQSSDASHVALRRTTSSAIYPSGIGAIGAGLPRNGFSDSGGASRFLYVSKASRAEREQGLEGAALTAPGLYAQDEWSRRNMGSTPDAIRRPVANGHPTVKPVDLMRWLVRLVTQPGDVVLDPFAGSGTTGMACVHEGRDFVGIEMDPEYAEIARRRIASVQPTMFTVPAVETCTNGMT
jgi:site-specific DNA-methyltransferase (adenine-specific)